MGVIWGEKRDWSDYHRRLREEVRLEQVLGLFGVQLPNRRPQNGYKVLCPVHGEKKPSMHVYSEQNRVWCYGSCGRGYGPIELVAAIKKVRFVEAADWLGERFGISVKEVGSSGSTKYGGNGGVEQVVITRPKRQRGVFPPLIDANRARLYHRQLTKREYVWFEEERLIPRWLVDVVMLGHTLAGEWPPAFVMPVWGHRIGELVTMRFRLNDNDLLNIDDLPPEKRALAERRFWGVTDRNGVYPFGVWALSGGSDWIVICEAELDVLALMAQGIPAVTLTVGASGNSAWRDWERFLLPYSKWVVALDDDEAGRKATDVMRAKWPTRAVAFPWPTWEWNGVEKKEIVGSNGSREVREVKKAGDVTDFLKRFSLGQFFERIEIGLRRHRESVVGSSGSREYGRRLFWRGWRDVGVSVQWAR